MRKLQYLIRWAGYSQAHDSWEDAGDVFAPDLVKAYYNQKRTAIRELIFKQPSTCEEFSVSPAATTPHHFSFIHSLITNAQPTSLRSFLGSSHPTHDKFLVPVPTILTGPANGPAMSTAGTRIAYQRRYPPPRRITRTSCGMEWQRVGPRRPPANIDRAKGPAGPPARGAGKSV